MNRIDVDKRAWRLLEKRYLRQAESPDAEQVIEDQLTSKVDSLGSNGAKLDKFRQVIGQATELWARRSSLRKRDWLYLAAALLYFISPFDAIPDLLAGVGYMDDLIVVSAIVGMIARSLSTLSTRGKQHLEDWVDERADVVFERFDQSATNGVQNAVAAVAIGLWGATLAAAISLSVAAVVGHNPVEWVAYAGISAAIVVACNAMTGLYYWREYRKLDGKWQDRLRFLIASKLRLPHFVAIGVPIVILLGLGIGRVITSIGFTG